MAEYFFEVATVDSLWTEAKGLFAKHFVEISHRPELPLRPDIQGYRTAEERGHVACFSARRRGKIVGYAVFFLQRALLYQHMEAVCSMLYINPEDRGFGGIFIDWIDEKLKDQGMAEVYHHVPAKRDFSPLIERKGYELVDRLFVKKLI